MRIKTLLVSTFAAGMLLGLSACVETPMPLNNPPVNYSQKLRFDLAEVLVINDSSTTAATQQLSQYGQPLEAAMREWAAKRVQAAGTKGSYNVIIKDANFTITKLPVKKGFSGWMERQQAERWDAYLSVLISVEGSAGMYPPAEITVSVRSSQTLPQEASDSEKRATYTSITNKLMGLFDAKAQEQMNAYFRAYYL